MIEGGDRKMKSPNGITQVIEGGDPKMESPSGITHVIEGGSTFVIVSSCRDCCGSGQGRPSEPG